jgi:hypothetical protein
MPMKRKMIMKKNTDTEAITPPIHPKPHQIPYSLAHIQILPIEIRLFCNKKVEVILVRWLVVLPRRTCNVNVISVYMACGMVGAPELQRHNCRWVDLRKRISNYWEVGDSRRSHI